ncbi:secretoglobin family 2B member 2-like [Budorcas taxicolor]|uniref:secretoglobin family 2B member 2-like n=1 Tax=Budorcas taxicolor TaxID=37181 RepID=UPI002284ABBC|nr:secretoglobin family 2B member 2-like [Budorcas taxicolor]
MMKGALLVLALLVTRELTFKMTEVEACPVFYGGVAALLLGSKTLLNSTLDLVDTTDEEKAAFGKAQDCFNEAGLDAKLKMVELVGSIIFDEDCIGYQVSTVVNSLFGITLSAVSLVK